MSIARIDRFAVPPAEDEAFLAEWDAAGVPGVLHRAIRPDAPAATTRKITSAIQFSPSAIVKRPVGGMWKKLKASALARLVAIPSHTPHTVDTSNTPSR